MITLHQWGSDGLYIGSVEVDETGALPERSTPTAPPELTGSEVARWTGQGWEVLPAAPEPPPEPGPDWPALIAARRFQAETGGAVVEGLAVNTERDSQSLLTGAAFAASLDPAYRIKWKAASGFVELTGAQVIALASAVRAHVQACFDREAELLAAVADGSITAEMLEQGWP
ncbi:DUF4376 domain-containing protein [Pseudomonas guariconensis]|uniref:DUF4376 domain-containing protein n=1 Tax=Pseudomonas guariconensis TaxID=1288410 RepID=UPI002D1EDA59|nr:DUF4376 domain-containing protein [Pseudomonas guariconensis]MEB3843732.1 DUF4376 domain-containing protein [Pseudomonas guariconensis]MEB3876600.1 DUF4376 domain-containing protein [Pseudomonas guariconensis]MEB3881499.1 DUF4376 domain-containing protein [Pseudomonas guariconensis]MEB3898464.1 DUF4376 domain-containing protein [Pseudomonas guariconensis]